MTQDLTPEILSPLRFAPLFAGLAERDLLGLLEGAVVLRLEHGHALYDEGEAAGDLHVVLDGHVELSVMVESRRSVVEVAGRPDVLGDAAVFGGGGHLTSARVLSRAVVLAIPAAGFRSRLEGRMDLMIQMLAAMSLRLRMLVRQIAELKLKTTAQRLGSFLLSLAGPEEGRAELSFPYDKRLVADQLGMKPESLSRALAKLSGVGIDSRSDGTVVVADLARLRDFCAEEEA